MSLRRESAGGAGQDFWALIRELGLPVLPNTAGCHTVKEAVTTARMAREVFDTDWIKLEVIGHTDSSNPNAMRAYEDSTDKAINVAQQLINYGMSPRKITIGGKGFYDPVTNGITTQDLAKNRRTEILVTVAE